jgi:outer membrane protein
MRHLLTALCALGASQVAFAQTPARPTGPDLTVEQATTIARQNNPDHLSLLNNRNVARAQTRNAYGQLLPSLSASFGTQYTQGGTQIFNGGTFGASSDVVQSSYGLDVSYRINAAAVLAPKVMKASRDAVDADINGSAEVLRANVVQQYLTVLQMQARAELADTLVAFSAAQLNLAQARANAGIATILDVRRAEVDLGQNQVGQLQARNNIEIEKLRLFQRMGISAQRDVVLSSRFPITEPTFTQEEVLSLAKQRNPVLLALRSRLKVADISVKAEKGEYSPTLSLSTGWSGYTYQYRDADLLIASGRQNALNARASCFSQDSIRAATGMGRLNCGQIDFTSADANALRSNNQQFPFNFTKSPFSLRASLSLPLFDGLSRELRVEQSYAQKADAKYNVRARELALEADVTSAYLTLVTAFRTVQLQEQNARKAREELTFAEERYRVGSVTFLDVSSARVSFERAENDRINAIYDYHKAFAALESAVGRPLR